MPVKADPVGEAAVTTPPAGELASARRASLEDGHPGLLWKGEPDLGGWYTEEECAAAEQAIRASMDWKAHYHPQYRRRFEEAFAAYVGTAHAVATNSAGTGLDMAMACLDARPGDEVVSCATNFPGTHLAVIGRGLRLVLSEPHPRTLNLDPADVAARITPRTRAVLVTHMNGLAADVDVIEQAIHEAARHHGNPPKIICDAARACGAASPLGRVGKTGWMTVFSFQRRKLMTTLGEGGMITTDCADVAAKLRRLQSFGGGVDWGTNYKMTEVQAAVGLVQLGRLDAMNDARIATAHERTRRLKDIAALTLPTAPTGYRHVYHLYSLLLHEQAEQQIRDRLVDRLAHEYRVGCVIANPPTYQSNQLIRRHTAGQGPFPTAERVGKRLFCPVLHPLMTAAENEYVADAIRECLSTMGLA